MSREEWLAERRLSIGASDCAAVCGLSPWATAYSVWLDKTGALPPQPLLPQLAWGLRLEPAIAAAYAEETGEELLPFDGAIRRHAIHPWMSCTPDRITRSGRVVELKTASAYAASEWGPAGTDGIPDGYTMQVQHQMEVLGLDVADVAVLIGGQDFRIYTVQREPRLIAYLVEIEAAFWHLVQTRTAPQPDWCHPRTAGLLASLYGVDDDLALVLPPEAAHWADLYESYGEAASQANELRQEAKARLVYLMGPASRGYLPDGRQIVRKRVQRRGYSVAASEYTTFRIKPAKEPKA